MDRLAIDARIKMGASPATIHLGDCRRSLPSRRIGWSFLFIWSVLF